VKPDSRRAVKLGYHGFRATSITAYLEAGGMLENAPAMAARIPRTTELSDRKATKSRSPRSSGLPFQTGFLSSLLPLR
jgi:hypothetical protein